MASRDEHDEQKSSGLSDLAAPVAAAPSPSPSVVRVPKPAGSNHLAEPVRSSRPRSGAHANGAQAGLASGRPSTDLPETYGVDEVEILCKDPWWYFVYWEVTDAGLSAAREQLGGSAKTAKLVLRAFIGASNTAVKGRETRDVPLLAQHGRRYLEAPRSNTLLRVAVGLLSLEGYFAPIAHSSLLRVPPQQPSSDTRVEWLHVTPAHSDGRLHERIVKEPPAAPHIERELPWRSGEAGTASAAVATTESVLQIPAPPLAGGASNRSRPPRKDGSEAS